MDRTVSAALVIRVETPARLAFQVAVADPSGSAAVEDVDMTLDGEPVVWSELATSHGGRLWLFDSPAGLLRLDYRASSIGLAPGASVDVGDQLAYLRPSRYCESDRMIGFAARHFRGIRSPLDILAAVSSWVGTQLEYIAGSSGPTDGAVDTLLAPRRSLIRIATGRDAADTAFLSNYGGTVRLESMTVTATTAGNLPTDNIRELAWLN